MFRIARSQTTALLLIASTIAVSVPGAYSQSTLIPVLNRRDMVFDHAGRYLYITTSDGWVRRYNLATQELAPGYNLEGALNGLDIAPDDSFLLVAQDVVTNSVGRVHRVDLNTGATTNIIYPVGDSEKAGAWEVVIAANQRAFVTSSYAHDLSSGAIPLREIDLANNTVRTRSDAPGAYGNRGLPQRTRIQRSADYRRCYFLQADIDSGPVFSYDAEADSFSRSVASSSFLSRAPAAISRDGTLAATVLGIGYGSTDLHVSIDRAADFKHVRSIVGIVRGVAFDPLSDVLYGVTAGASQVIAYDSNNFEEKFRIAVGESISAPPEPSQLADFTSRVLVASPDGRFLALQTPTGVRLFDLLSVARLPAPQPSLGKPQGLVFDHSGRYLYITTASGLLWRYNLLTNRLDAQHDLGGALRGVDIASDDSFLLVGQGKQGIAEGVFEQVDLNTGAVRLLPYRRDERESGVWDVGIASNGLAFATTRTRSTGSTRVRQVNLATGSVTTRADTPGSSGSAGVAGSTQIEHSADRTRLFVVDPGGAAFIYDAATNVFGPPIANGGYLHSYGAVSRDGSLLGLRKSLSTTVGTAPSLDSARSAPIGDSGLAFDAANDVLYGVDGSADVVVAFDTGSFRQKERFAIGEDVPANLGGSPILRKFDAGTLVADQRGALLAVTTPDSVRVLALGTKASARVPTTIAGHSAQLLNVSTRMRVQRGDNALIGGFIVGGDRPKRVMIRAIGPSLRTSGVPGYLPNPTLELRDESGALLVSNDNWKVNDQTQQSQQSEIEDSELQPANDLESAMVVTLQPQRGYTAITRGKGDSSGVGLVEIYDLEPASESQLANISTRGLVETGDGVMIAGFIVGGTQQGAANLIVRAIGPSLRTAGIENPLENPVVALHDSNGTLIALNDNWQMNDQARLSQEGEVRATGLAPAAASEAVILTTLPAGAYTAIVSGKGNTVGTAVVEVYRLP